LNQLGGARRHLGEQNLMEYIFNRNKILRNVHSKQLKRKSNIVGISACCRAVTRDETECEESLRQAQAASRSTKEL